MTTTKTIIRHILQQAYHRSSFCIELVINNKNTTIKEHSRKDVFKMKVTAKFGKRIFQYIQLNTKDIQFNNNFICFPIITDNRLFLYIRGIN